MVLSRMIRFINKDFWQFFVAYFKNDSLIFFKMVIESYNCAFFILTFIGDFHRFTFAVFFFILIRFWWIFVFDKKTLNLEY